MRMFLQILVLSISVLFFYSCGTPSPFPLSLPSNAYNDDRIVGNWKMEEDTNGYNFYEITQRDTVDRFNYHVRFFNRGGTNPTYEANVFFSQIGGYGANTVRFLNVPYIEVNGHTWRDKGYFLVRILEMNDDLTEVTTATVDHKALTEMKRTEELNGFINDNIDNPKIYSDTVHFYKVDKTTAELRQPRSNK